jgi:hypothetical protein
MALLIELCRTCGFDIPADEGDCPVCARGAPRPSRAAQQVAGLALPTRSVRRLPTTRPRREPAPPLGRARAARSAFSFSTAFALITFAAAGLSWLSGRPSLVLRVPPSTTARLDDLTTLAATASVVAMVVGVVAMLAWSARAAARALIALADRRHT